MKIAEDKLTIIGETPCWIKTEMTRQDQFLGEYLRLFQAKLLQSLYSNFGSKNYYAQVLRRIKIATVCA